MPENAELLVLKGNERSAVEAWLIHNNIKYNRNASTEELIELYRRVECGEY